MKKGLTVRKMLALSLVCTIILLNSSLSHAQTLSSAQMLIKFKPTATEIDATSYKNSLGAIELAKSPLSEIRLWSIPSFTTASANFGWTNINEVVNGSGNKPEVNSAGFNYDSTLPSFDHGNASSSSYDPTNICPEFSIFPGAKPQTVKVAILDTGIGYTGSNSNPSFCNPTIFSPYYGTTIGYDFVNNDNQPQDDHGHGTHIAGIIAQMALLSPDLDLELLSFKTHDYQGHGSIFNVILATDQAVLMGANIINMSFSYPATPPGSKPDPLQVAIENAGDQGVLVVAAAGNLDPGAPLITSFYPAAYPCDNIISVASVTCDRKLSTFSAWGVPEVDIAMLGENISGPHHVSGNMVLKSGTSQASAIVAGIAAQLASNLDVIRYEQLKCAIMTGAEYSDNLIDLVLTEGVANGPEAMIYLLDDCALAPSPTDSSIGTLAANISGTVASGEILSVFPNPFSEALSLSVKAEQAGEITFSVYNAQGSLMHTEKKMMDVPGEVSFEWIPGRTHAPGLYFTRIQVAGQTITKKVVKD